MLKRIHIENFKSLKDVTLELQPVNLLIGPNNSGKSNLLKALEFFDKYEAQTGISDIITENLFKHLQSNFSTLLTFETSIEKYFTLCQENISANEIRHTSWNDLLTRKVSEPKYMTKQEDKNRLLRKITIYNPTH